MIAEYLERARAWFGRTVRDSAVRQFARSVQGDRVRGAIPPLSSFVAGSAVLIGQLTLAAGGWPESFAAFILASPLLTVAVLAALALATYPPCAQAVPVWALAGFVLLGSLQALLGAAVSIAPSPPGRVQFALLTAGIVMLGVMILSKHAVSRACEAGRRTRDRFRDAVDRAPPPSVPEEPEDRDSGDSEDD
ncbi:MAG: hypothetical protein EOO66_17020 [Methylobacterium sp.]|nr:MAG: hypothetical protein EOO66_17020 [Methylobacterium sp.]